MFLSIKNIKEIRFCDEDEVCFYLPVNDDYIFLTENVIDILEANLSKKHVYEIEIDCEIIISNNENLKTTITLNLLLEEFIKLFNN